MSAKPDSTVKGYFKMLTNAMNKSIAFEAFNVDDYTVKFYLAEGRQKHYFEVSNFEHSGVTLSLYTVVDNIHHSNNIFMGSRQHTFKAFESAHALQSCLATLTGLNGVL